MEVEDEEERSTPGEHKVKKETGQKVQDEVKGGLVDLEIMFPRTPKT